ncbi:hypothetical protein [Pseudoduganella sp.]|uniref:DUF6891 domain-containing protein n=1 Tax=Pseudoduganella sp. TaxID=1880898 RepID=UPI0035B016AA
MNELNEEELYIAGQVKMWVWSGFYDENDVAEGMDEIVEGEVDVARLRALAAEEFRRKARQELAWPVRTDCDRLDSAFHDLNNARIIALQNSGYTMSDGHSDVGEVHASQPPGTFKGYCFYHAQDMERAIDGHGLMLAYGDMKDTDAGKAEVAAAIVDALARHGLRAEWNGDVGSHINVPAIQWQRRLLFRRPE